MGDELLGSFVPGNNFKGLLKNHDREKNSCIQFMCMYACYQNDVNYDNQAHRWWKLIDLVSNSQKPHGKKSNENSGENYIIVTLGVRGLNLISPYLQGTTDCRNSTNLRASALDA